MEWFYCISLILKVSIANEDLLKGLQDFQQKANIEEEEKKPTGKGTQENQYEDITQANI